MTIQITIKNPTRLHDDTLTISVDPHMSLGELKTKLQAEYPDHPAPQAITLIYAGKVLKDESALLASFLPTDTDAVVLHIVVKAATTAQPPRPSSASQVAITSVGETQSETTQPPPSSVSPAMNVPPNPPAGGTATTASGSEEATNNGGSVPSAEGPSIPPLPYVPVAASMVHQSQDNLYAPAYAAAYQAALAALVSQTAGSNSSSSQAGTPQQMMQTPPHQAYAFVPAMVPMPQPVLPFFMHSQQQGEDQQQQQGLRPQVVMQMPMMHMPFGYPLPPHMELRQRHQHQHPENRQAGAAAAQPPPPPPPPPPGAPLNNNLVAMLRAFQDHGAVLPPHLAEAVRQAEARPAPRLAAPRRVQFRVRVNMRALLQLAVMLVVVYQHCPPQRFLILCALGAVLFLSTTPRVRALIQRLTGWQQGNQDGADLAAARQAVAAAGAPPAAPVAHQVEGQEPDAAGVPAAAGAAINPEANPAARPRGILHEIHAFIAGFITSLLPALDRDHAGLQGDMQNVF